MLNFKIVLITLTLLSLVLGQNNSTNVTVDCNINNPYCDNRGVCQLSGLCRCFVGFYSSDASRIGQDCLQKSPNDVSNQIRIFVGVSYGMLFLLMAYRLILEFSFSSSEVGAAKYTARWNMALISVYCIWMAIQSVDYGGIYGLMRPKTWYALYFMRDNFHLFIFCSLLFHWAELYYTSINKMKKAMMLQKIKPDYEANVTMDSVLLELNYMSRFRLAYVAICILSLLVYIGQNCNNAFSQKVTEFNAFQLFYEIFYMVIWVLFACGYIYYGFKLLKILPTNSTGKIISVMSLMGIFAVVASTTAALNLELIIHLGGSNPTQIRYKILASYVLSWIVGFCAINIFMPIWEWHRWMNPFLIHSMIVSDSSKGISRSKSQSAKEIDLSATANTLEQSEDLNIDTSVQMGDSPSMGSEVVDKTEIPPEIV